MSKEALRLADALARALLETDAEDQVIHVARWFVDDSEAELRRLSAQVEALEADAARYRWLRDHVLENEILVYSRGTELDAAIDAAIAKEQT